MLQEMYQGMYFTESHGEHMKYCLIVLLFLFVSGLALADGPDSDALSPYLDASERTISAQEYSDLKAYIERAQKVLDRTLTGSTEYAGPKLREYLLHGIELALKSSDLRGDLLLFRYVLTRALELDQMYVGANNRATFELEQLSAQVILLPAIESALGYYQSSDLPRLATTVVPSPNWQEFAADQVLHLLRSIDLAPTKFVRAKLARVAAGWTAKALNSALDRRTPEMADFIVALGELYNEPNTRQSSYVSRVQEALLAVYKKFRKPLQELVLAPASSGDELKVRELSTVGKVLAALNLPLIKMGKARPVGVNINDGNKAQWDFVRASLTLGGGVGKKYINGDRTIPSTSVLVAEGDAVYTAPFLNNDKNVVLAPVAFGQIYVKGGITLQPGGDVLQSRSWEYTANASITGGVLGLIVPYFGIDKNSFEKFSDQFARAGWAPQLLVRTGDKQYVFFRTFVGAAKVVHKIGDGETITADSVGAFGGAVIYRGNRVSSEISADYSVVDKSTPSRLGLDASATVRLGLLFSRDMIHLKGKVISYSNDDAPEKDASLVSGLVVYGLTW